MALANQRIAWFNGKFVLESEVLIPYRDQGFLRGDAVFDMTRSFNGKAFRLEQHVARLYRRDGGDQRGGAGAQPASARRG
jgi:branched-chain amino acid aminotransferase